MTVSRHAEMDVLGIEIECLEGRDPQATAKKVAAAIRWALGLNAQVQAVPHNSLHRFELKARRFVVER